MKKNIKKWIEDLKESLLDMNLDEKVETINYIKNVIHEISPFSEPVDNVQWVKCEHVFANEYNP